MKFLRRKFPWIAAGLLLAIAWNCWPAGQERRPETRRPSPILSLPHGSAGSRKSPDRNAQSTVQTHPADPEITRLIEQSLAAFRTSSSAEESAAILKRVRDGIRRATAENAAAAIVEFLKSGQDSPTLLPFVVGPEGMMELTPTLRTALLDLLPSLDPTAALELARDVMDQKSSPDEYALALRNLAWNDLDGDLKSELASRLGQMLAVEDWLSTPSAGFLEALDATVELADAETFGTLSRLNREALASGNSAMARASFIALDRMLLRDPSLLVKAFAADPGLSGVSPDQRASLLSRLDITNPAQRELFSAYLATPDREAQELEYFAALFPNGNFVHGNWLITTGEATDSISSRLEADRKALVEIDRLLAENPQANAAVALSRIRERLARITAGPHYRVTDK
jgi:hypothetical protein